ncbi:MULTISPECIES: hypothetical protein [Dermacoccus]|uniref:Uncharacterized protein n=2 Tax=Dermacoccus TaxID=57495 RepID=A0A417Z0L5_9MICO|nr:hypothetical protein [Dermacoccus abyssi]RHW43757.1 hypothetical protein D1832_14230 [Dermacoccus abyssi]
MAGKTRSVSARERARSRRAELEEKRRAQRELIEEHQVAYFAAEDDVAAFDRKIEAKRAELAELESRRDDETQDARDRQTLAMGALVVEAGQPIEDVAILLDVTTAEVKRARTAYNKRADVATDSPEAPATADGDGEGSHEG